MQQNRSLGIVNVEILRRCDDQSKNSQHYTQDDYTLTEVAGEGGTNWAPQKFLSSQKFRHLMGKS